MTWLTFHLIVRVCAGLLVATFLFSIVRVINSAANTLEWADLLSVPARDGGRQRASWDQIGKGLGVVLCVWLPAVYVYSPKLEAVGLAAVMGVALLYLAGVSAYAATLRSRQGSVTTTTEPVPDPVPSKVTVVEAAPVAAKGKK